MKRNKVKRLMSVLSDDTVLVSDLNRLMYLNILTRPSVHPLVVEDDVWHPDQLRGHPDGRHVVVVRRVPAQLVVVPFLGERRREQSPTAQCQRPLPYGNTLSNTVTVICTDEDD